MATNTVRIDTVLNIALSPFIGTIITISAWQAASHLSNCNIFPHVGWKRPEQYFLGHLVTWSFDPQPQARMRLQEQVQRDDQKQADTDHRIDVKKSPVDTREVFGADQ